MASKSAKRKPFTFPCILFLIALVFFTICYVQQLNEEFQNGTIFYGPAKLGKNPEWFDVVLHETGHEDINVGLVNMGGEIVEAFHTKGDAVEIPFDLVQKNIRWSDLYPEWIDENAPPNCPNLPMPKFKEYRELDVVVARLPCTKCDEENELIRDVFRLQVNLVVANLLVRSGRMDRPVFAVFVGSSGPMWEIFRCDDLLWNDGNFWVYKPQLDRVRQKIVMPVGSCQVAPLATHQDAKMSRPGRREAYVTVLHSSESYVCGAIALAQSIIQSNSTKDLVLLADEHMSPSSIDGLQSAGWKVRRIERIRSPHSRKYAYNEWNYSKLRIWQLTEYDKLIFIDADLIVTKNLDRHFAYPQISAAGNDRHLFNSGMMVIEPSECTFNTLMKKRFTVGSYNGGDQGFLNEMFPWWHRLSSKANSLKFFTSTDDHVHRMADDVLAMHYLGLKPWLCYRDYDCNWDKAETRQFASDSAHKRWWQVYSKMPKKLRKYCRLTPRMKSRIQKYRSKARSENYPDGHWRIKIKDPRRNST